MNVPGKRVPWMLVAWAGTVGVLIPGCGPGPCTHWVAEFDFETDELLVIDDIPLDTLVEAPTLLTTGIHEEGWVETCEMPLAHVSENSLTFDVANPGCRFGTSAQAGTEDPDGVQPENFTLSFEFVQAEGWAGEGDTGEGLVFDTMEVPGDTFQVELWNGWTMEIEWALPSAMCK